MKISEEKKYDKNVDVCDKALIKQYEIFKTTVEKASDWGMLVHDLGGSGDKGVKPLHGDFEGWCEARLGDGARVIFRGEGGTVVIKLIDKNHSACKLKHRS